jgi:heat shock protein HslJ
MQGIPGATPSQGLLGRWVLRQGPPDGPSLAGFGIELEFTGSTGAASVAGRPGLGPASGTVAGLGGVNRFRGSYWQVADPVASHQAGILAFGPLVATMMAGPPPAMAAERAFLAALDRVRGYRLTGPELVLLADAGLVVAQLERARPALLTV